VTRRELDRLACRHSSGQRQSQGPPAFNSYCQEARCWSSSPAQQAVSPLPPHDPPPTRTDPECRALVLLSAIICNTIGSAILHRVHPTAMEIPGHPVRAAAMGKDQCLPTSWLPAAEIHCPSPLRGRRRTAERSCLLPVVERERVSSESTYLLYSTIVLFAYPPLSYHLQKIINRFRVPPSSM
jgi:hypothetical protein